MGEKMNGKIDIKKKTYFLRSANCKLLSDIRRISINGCTYF